MDEAKVGEGKRRERGEGLADRSLSASAASSRIESKIEPLLHISHSRAHPPASPRAAAPLPNAARRSYSSAPPRARRPPPLYLSLSSDQRWWPSLAPADVRTVMCDPHWHVAS
uniref:Uncharacterized protein n=1 Tax=Oryza meridionalis TaxID=40149 RepID=A0A0E0E110_9ORYZ